MKKSISVLLFSASFAFLNCNISTSNSEVEPGNSSIKKAPLVFDESRLLRPPTNRGDDGVLKKTNSTYYTFWKFNGFGFPVSIQPDDCDAQMGFNNDYGCGITSPWVDHMEATYSSRLAANPELLWQRVNIPNVPYKALQSGTLLDNEQVESHLYPSRTFAGGSYVNIHVSIDYEVSSEQGWDYLWITSTASDGNCNSPGVVRAKVSGQMSGNVSFVIPGACATPWIGAYYIKDGSISAGGDYARIKNVSLLGFSN